MAEEVKEVKEQVIEQTEEATVPVSVLEKLKSLFGKEEPPEPKKEDDFEKRVVEEVNKALGEIIPKAKKAKEEELENQKQELEKQKQETQLNSELEKVDESYRDYVKFQLQQTGQSMDDFLKENTQFKTKTLPNGRNANNKKGVELEGVNKEIYDRFKRTGVF